jgi:hypothetical protein
MAPCASCHRMPSRAEACWLDRPVAGTVALISRDMKSSLIVDGHVIGPSAAGSLTAVSQTGGTAPDLGVLTGRPVDPDLRKRTPP